MTAQNNTRLTSLIEHMFDMIKRAIDKTLAPVHIKIQDLEHRVSELDGIGAREALAAFKEDMRKDEDLEDEREETDGEVLEEDPMTKELDKERQVEVATQRSMDDITTQMVGAGQVLMLQQETMLTP
ncbi:hypothetical protein HAX54_011386 [Datura stramonium]|uniref:Uncharacterized protein n=1 Tax=Datura stramonium TaxID=4076 RepID=A0ABS8Y3E2_DATST|nr:hypothetical protein [Datura stramonium]